MGDLLIRNVPDDLKRDLAEAARLAGRSLSDEAKRRLRQSAPTESSLPRTGTELLQSMQAFLSDVAVADGEDFAEIVNEVVEQRKRDADSPSPFEE